jgi:hypothetical protein
MLATIEFRTFYHRKMQIRIYETIIFLVVLYGCKTWFQTLRDEHRLGVFGPKRNEMMGGNKELHNEELRDLYTSRVVNGVMCLFIFCDFFCFHVSKKFFMYFCA